MSDLMGFTLRDGADLAGVDLVDLWWRYLALGGASDLTLLSQRVRGLIPCAAHEHDLIAQALNEVFLDQGAAAFPVAYSGAPVSSTSARSSRVGGSTSPEQARRNAGAARRRSAAAAQQAAVLHASAAALMQASGQLQFARQARARSLGAQRRSLALAGA